MFRQILLTVFCIGSIVSPAHGLVNGQAPAQDNQQYDAVAAFSKTPWLNKNDDDNHHNNWFGNGVLIAPDVLLTAKHLLPGGGKPAKRPGAMTVRFRRHTDGSIGSKSEGPDSYHQVRIKQWISADRFDLAICILEQPVEHIKPMPMMLEKTELESRRAMLAGWGSESPWRGNGGPRNELKIGENTVTSRGGFLAIDSTKTEMRENDKGERKAYFIDENACANMHDSGGSMFVFDQDDNPVLVGIITTYGGGVYLPAAAEAGFPLEAASKGSEALEQFLEDTE